MFPQRALLLRQQGRGGWQGYDETPEQHAQGGLLPGGPVADDGSASAGDDGSVKAMEQDEEGDAGEDNQVPWVFPDISTTHSVVLAVPGNPSRVFWPVQYVPSGLLGLPPQILQALPKADPALLENSCSGACWRCVLPSALCESPLLMLLSSAAACAAAIKAGRPPNKAEAPTHERYASYIQLVIRLQQWKAAVMECVTSFHESMRPRDIWNAQRDYSRENAAWEARQNEELEALYFRNAPLIDHVHIWQRHAVEYIHLLERFLYECLVVRIPGAPALANLLTPFYWPEASECSPALRAQEHDDALKFFKFKCDNGGQNSGLAPPHLYNQSTGPLWLGWYSMEYLATYREYLRDSDYAQVVE